MKKKKWLVVSLIFLSCILSLAFILNLFNRRNNIDDLILQLEKSINNCDLKGIVNLYPNYYRDTVSGLLSEDNLIEFNSKVGNISVNIVGQTNYDLSQSKDIQNEIEKEYNINLKTEDYQIVIMNVSNNIGSVFEQTQLEVIKIKGQYYLYTEYHLGDLIQCFVE